LGSAEIPDKSTNATFTFFSTQLLVNALFLAVEIFCIVGFMRVVNEIRNPKI